MFDKIKNWLLIILSVLVGILGFSIITKNDEEKLKKAKDNIEKAGENIEAEHFNNANNAAKYIDDILTNISKRNSTKKH